MVWPFNIVLESAISFDSEHFPEMAKIAGQESLKYMVFEMWFAQFFGCRCYFTSLINYQVSRNVVLLCLEIVLVLDVSREGPYILYAHSLH